MSVDRKHFKQSSESLFLAPEGRHTCRSSGDFKKLFDLLKVYDLLSMFNFKRKRYRTSFNILYCYGGSGSSFLIHRMKAFSRPDIWQPAFNGKRLSEWEHLTRVPGALLDERGYDVKNKDFWEEFNCRTEGKFADSLNPKLTINENLENFCSWIRTTQYKVVFVHAAILQFFSKNNIQDVTFIIRHPLHAYISFAKEERHKKEIDALGGTENDKAIEFWADRWNNIVKEYMLAKEKMLNPILIRFEYAHGDSKVSKFHKNLFKDFDSTKRNNNVLSMQGEQLLRAQVEEYYFRIYETWQM